MVTLSAACHQDDSPDPTPWISSMTSPPADSGPSSDAPVEEKIAAARAGSAKALGQLFETFRRYLLLVANRALDADLQAKVGASDLVQETFLQAQKAFGGFAGRTERDLVAWLHGILVNNIADLTRHYRHTAKRQVSLEVPLNLDDPSGDRAKGLAAQTESPSWQALSREEDERLQEALRRLPAHYLQVIQLRNRDGQSFAAIGAKMNRTADAARMLWLRALKQLQQELEGHHGQP
jgi:RNA polymerase sigma-70 factor (ECF subfamily)